jgi:bis(5'-nucleosyl)-tetraphosphatase (symmetrical)
MAVYAIGDIQGCYSQLNRLLEAISYDESQDELWFVGDLVNRGPESLQALRFIKALPRKRVVLGNHDLHLLALAYGYEYDPKHNLHELITAADCAELVGWLREQPLVHYDQQRDALLVHAGIVPQWDLPTTLSRAYEAYACYNNDVSDHKLRFALQYLFGDIDIEEEDKKQYWDRIRCTVDVCTRLRFCTQQGVVDYRYKGKPGSQPQHLRPWFSWPQRQIRSTRIFFGHWAALEGYADASNVFALDTGCIWGGAMTAVDVDKELFFSLDCCP